MLQLERFSGNLHLLARMGFGRKRSARLDEIISAYLEAMDRGEHPDAREIIESQSQFNRFTASSWPGAGKGFNPHDEGQFGEYQLLEGIDPSAPR